ncbi:hypothetical protein BCV69DRAFT_298835 [Microstroma glucosiphilum]|uniref:Uncharacterized protein n=1 Tax=Pseudomicrostroma glucosiphilum TaxID=1684307 RepID=A0A316U871_9BASI|nr:hypothetical protein BCV69DRAFT_298835 [Pseudomicrostroma glucosiphilum]PWN21044.1 hypothetical protein BCV69DRAFT_298835 [Pseudomicrostroma glucosiphilum]
MSLSLFAKTATRSFASAQASRGFATSAIARRDLIQEAYLRELKAYKPAAKSADSHKGQVREFHQPSPPKAPATPSSSSLSSELDSYASSEPDVAEVSKSSSTEEVSVGGGAKEFLEEARRDYPKEEAHH